MGCWLLSTKVGLKFGTCAAFVVGQVADDDTMLQQGDTGRDVYRMLQVVAGDEDGGTCLLLVVGKQVFQDQLRGGVEEVEGLVEDDNLWLAE